MKGFYFVPVIYFKYGESPVVWSTAKMCRAACFPAFINQHFCFPVYLTSLKSSFWLELLLWVFFIGNLWVITSSHLCPFGFDRMFCCKHFSNKSFFTGFSFKVKSCLCYVNCAQINSVWWLLLASGQMKTGKEGNVVSTNPSAECQRS